MKNANMDPIRVATVTKRELILKIKMFYFFRVQNTIKVVDRDRITDREGKIKFRFRAVVPFASRCFF